MNDIELNGNFLEEFSVFDHHDVFSNEPVFVEEESTEHHRKQSFGSLKRVRFEDELHGSDSTTSDSEPDTSIIPDLFLQQDSSINLHLNPIPNSLHLVESRNGSDSDGSFWDFNGHEEQQLVEHILEDIDSECNEESVAGSSGYESKRGLYF